MDKVENLLARLSGVKGGNGKWIAQCPAHSDRSPSLGIKTDGDKILINCLSGCGAGDVLDSIGMTFSDLFPDRPEKGNYQRFSKSEFYDIAVNEAGILKIALGDVLRGRKLSKNDLDRVKEAVIKINNMQKEIYHERQRLYKAKT